MKNRDGFISLYISLCVGATLYGAFLVSMPGSIRAIGQGRGKWWLHVIAAVLFVLVTLDISLLNARLGLTVLQCYMSGPENDENCDPIPWFNRAQTFTVGFSTLLAESAMIYRCWVLYSRNWIVVAVPSFLWIHGLGMIIYTAIVQNNSGGYSGSSEEVCDAVQICFWVLTVIVKVMTTALIVRKLQVTQTLIAKGRLKIRTTTLYGTVEESVMESGLMCIVASLFVLISRFCQIISVLAPTVMIMVSGISLNLIPIRVDQYRRQEERKECAPTVSTLYCSTGSVLQPPKVHLKTEP